MESRRLRTGFTTGTCAAAAASAALAAIIHQKNIQRTEVLLPKGRTMEIGIKKCEFSKGWARCSVVKDGGDDPDVTHGAEIVSEVRLAGKKDSIEVYGGEGVGTVTKPGLGLEIGGPAINPTPKRMISQNIRRVGAAVLEEGGVHVTVSVPRGRELAPKTDNPRLGITGGISILGTSGIVIPFSTASFAASIRQNIDVAVAMGDRRVVLTTGGRSEDYARGIMQLPDHCFIQMGDFAGYTMQQCAKKGIEEAFVVGFIGKLSKMAKGTRQTHVKGSKVDMAFLAELAKTSGAPDHTIRQVAGANTARHVLEIMDGAGGFFEAICARACSEMWGHGEQKVPIEVIMFDFDGGVLARYSTRQGVL